MYMLWKQDPTSVHVSWQVYFRNMESGDMPVSQAFQPPPTLVAPQGHFGGDFKPGMGMGTNEGSDVMNHLKVQLLVRAYQARGHHKARIDPLGIRTEAEQFGYSKPRELELSHYNFTEKDLDQDIELGPGILPRFKTEQRKKMTLREIIAACERLYCGSYGVEYIHIPDREQCDWLRERLEIPQPFKYSVDEKRRILDRLIWGTNFEAFLATKYPNDKRFGLEGGESLIPGMKALIDRSVDYGVKDIVIGMPHRGRLNVLSNVVRKPNESIFSEFAGTAEPNDEGSGDVKYHLGMNFLPASACSSLWSPTPPILRQRTQLFLARPVLSCTTTTTRKTPLAPWVSSCTVTRLSLAKVSCTRPWDSISSPATTLEEPSTSS
jgi:2-oxoglutarate dehydrogenase E1 component